MHSGGVGSAEVAGHSTSDRSASAMVRRLGRNRLELDRAGPFVVAMGSKSSRRCCRSAWPKGCPDYLDGGLRRRGRQSEVVRHSRPLSRRPNPWTDTSNSLGAGYHPAAGVSLGGLVQMAGDVTGGPGRKAMKKAENLR